MEIKIASASEQHGSRAWFTRISEGRHTATQHMMRYFAWTHLRPEIAEASRMVGEVAVDLMDTLPDGPELTAGLRKLLEAKDCFVRAALDRVEEKHA